MDRLHAQFIAPGALAFDIGAHVGDRTDSFLRLGASVVALEPQPRLFRALRLLHGRKSAVRLLRCAAGQAPGQAMLHLNTRNPTVATLSADFIAAAQGASGWDGQIWDGRVSVPVTTLDTLVGRFGCPDFVKIDVEGHELAVLQGSTRPLPLLSFEVTLIQIDMALACIAHLQSLGSYAYNLSLGEDHRLRHDTWLSADGICAALRALPADANSGDVFARRL